MSVKYVHVEVHSTLAKSASAANRFKTPQFIFFTATLNAVYADTPYSASLKNLAAVSGK